MATKKPSPVRPDVMRADQAALNALTKMTGYNPNNPAMKVDVLQTLSDARDTAQNEAADAANAWNAKRDAAADADRAFHKAIKLAKKEVVVQFGEDSNEVASMGMKKAVEYKRPQRKKKAA